jgi:uncharacterized protein (TIGR03382 family)
MLRELLLIAVSLVAVVPVASSQTVKVSDSSAILDVSATGDADGTANVTFGIQDCLNLFAEDPDISVSWTFTSKPATGNDYQIKLQHGSESCSFTEIDAATDVCLRDDATAFSTSGTPTATYTWSELVNDAALTASTCYEGGLSSPWTIALVYESSSSLLGASTFSKSQAILTLDASRPTPPTELRTAGGETAIEVRWTASSSAVSYEIWADTTPIASRVTLPEEAPSGLRVKSVEGGDTTSGSISGLTTGVTYYIVVLAIDEAGNLSTVSEEVTGATAPTADFFESYKAAGGVEAGGQCSASTPAAGWMTMASLGVAMWLIRRRRRVLVGGSMLALALAVSGEAHAGQRSSPVDSTLDLRFGSWKPAIDQEPSLAAPKPFAQIFDGDDLFYVEGVYGRELLRGVGSLGLNLSLGYGGVAGKSLDLDGASSGDTTTFRMAPLRLGAFYRFDWLQERFGVPVVLAGEAGLTSIQWWTSSESGISDFETASGVRSVGSGETHGWHAGGTAYLLLDIFAPGMAMNFDADSGVNNSYLFVNYMQTEADDFGSKTSWSLSDTTTLFGIGFEM